MDFTFNGTIANQGIYITQEALNTYIDQIRYNIDLIPRIAFWLLLVGIALYFISQTISYWVKDDWSEGVREVGGNAIAMTVIFALPMIVPYVFGYTDAVLDTAEKISWIAGGVVVILAGVYFWQRKKKIKEYIEKINLEEKL